MNFSNSQVLELGQRAEGGRQRAGNLVGAKYPVEEKRGRENGRKCGIRPTVQL